MISVPTERIRRHWHGAHVSQCLSRRHLERLERMASHSLTGPAWHFTSRSLRGTPLQVRRRQHWRRIRSVVVHVHKVIRRRRAACTCWSTRIFKPLIVVGRLMRLAGGVKLGQLPEGSFPAVIWLAIGVLLRLPGFCYGQGQSAELPSAGYAHAPSQSGLVTRAVLALVKAWCAIWPAPIALGLTFLAGEAVICCASRWCSSAPLTWRCG